MFCLWERNLSFLKPLVRVVNVIAVAIVGAVAFFYIQEYRNYKKNRKIYVKIENCLSAIL